MPRRTMGFLAIYGRMPKPTKNIFSRGHGLKMKWIAAGSHATEVIKLLPGRYWALNSLKEELVG